jgi:glutamate/tyrosine decarboxylase-like PLP-dependent enzyme
VFISTGTTVLGAFDPLEKIADLCEKYKIWMHVDAAWGGKRTELEMFIVDLIDFCFTQAAP